MRSGIIVESALLAATTTDILQGTRLQTVPSNGVLTFEISADLATAAAFYTATIQLPDGDSPLTNVLVPASAVIGQLDDRNKLQVSFATGQGGHPVFSVVETGTALLIFRVTFTPARRPQVANVLTAFTLPAQAASGSVRRFALGGDGYRSPSGVYVVRNVSVTGDGTGSGNLTVTMGLDPNFVAMIGYVSMSISQATPATMRMKFQHVGALMATMQENRIAGFTNGAVVPEIAETWLPPAMLIPGVSPGTTSVVADNVGTDIMLFNANVFLYDIRSMEITPIDLLVGARGGV